MWNGRIRRWKSFVEIRHTRWLTTTKMSRSTQGSNWIKRGHQQNRSHSEKWGGYPEMKSWNNKKKEEQIIRLWWWFQSHKFWGYSLLTAISFMIVFVETAQSYEGNLKHIQLLLLVQFLKARTSRNYCPIYERGRKSSSQHFLNVWWIQPIFNVRFCMLDQFLNSFVNHSARIYVGEPTPEAIGVIGLPAL